MKEKSKEEILDLITGTEYITYNPFTNSFSINWAGPKDIAHNKHVISQLRYFVLEDK